MKGRLPRWVQKVQLLRAVECLGLDIKVFVVFKYVVEKCFSVILIVQLVVFFLELHYYFFRHCCLYPVLLLLLLLERGFFLYVVVNLSLIGTLVRILYIS